MKKILLLSLLLLISNTSIAQDKLYLIFEFMKVDNELEQAYMETELFWEGIHKQRVENGDILGWDLWSLQPGGENQGYQYLTVSLYNDPVKMMSGTGNFQAALEAAYPVISEEDRIAKFYNTAKSRDLEVRVYLEQIAVTEDDFEMPLGTIAGINLMKATGGDSEKYERFETEIFQPIHQKEIEEGKMENWSLMRYMLPVGSDVYASHITVDMYRDYHQLFKGWAQPGPSMSEDLLKKIQEGLSSRDLKYKYMATLIRKVR